VIGDAVNVASRLESANKDYGTEDHRREGNAPARRGPLRGSQLDRLTVYGREAGLAIYELLGVAEPGAAGLGRALRARPRRLSRARLRREFSSRS
jgi:adenylate cyclase